VPTWRAGWTTIWSRLWSARSGAPVALGGLEAGLNGTLRLDDIAVAGSLTAGSIELGYGLVDLLAGHLAPVELRVVRPHLRLEVRHLHPAHPRAGAIPAGLERKTDLVLRAMRSARLIDGPTYDRARADRLTLTPAAFQQ
jgi:hypothetical protein